MHTNVNTGISIAVHPWILGPLTVLIFLKLFQYFSHLLCKLSLLYAATSFRVPPTGSQVPLFPFSKLALSHNVNYIHYMENHKIPIFISEYFSKFQAHISITLLTFSLMGFELTSNSSDKSRTHESLL